MILTASTTRAFARHYAEMVIAMFAGMIVLGAAASLVFDLDAWHEDAPALLLLGMAFTMTAPMVAWMRYRGHGWAPSADMTVAMFGPSLLAIALGAFAGLDVGGQMAVQHVLMFPAMLVAMLLRRDEYIHH
jgi:hypothetical protein